jgi:hypothetical protein
VGGGFFVGVSSDGCVYICRAIDSVLFGAIVVAVVVAGGEGGGGGGGATEQAVGGHDVVRVQKCDIWW